MLLANVPSVDGSQEVSISGARAVTAEGDGGIGVLDVADPGAPGSLGIFPSDGFTTDVEMNDRFAFATFEMGSEGGLRIVQLERIGVDPTLVPEPHAAIGGLVALLTLGAVVRRRRSHRR